MDKVFKNPIEQSNNLTLHFPTKPVDQDMLDNEVRSMFKNRKEGLDYINSTYGEGEERNNALKRLDRVYPMVKNPNFEVGRFDKDGQVIENDSQFFDNEDEAIAFADSNGFDYVTGYTYKDGDENPNSSYEVWKRGK